MDFCQNINLISSLKA